MVMKGRQRVAEGGTGRHSVTALALAAGLVAAPCRPLPPLAAQSPVVLLATTTSTRDAGLLDSLLPVFERQDRKSTRLNSSHTVISYAVFCLKKKRNRKHALS